MIPEISHESFRQMLENETIRVLDIRTKEDFKERHIKGIPMLNIPFSDLIDEKTGDLKNSIKLQFDDEIPKNEKIIVVCYRGRSSALITVLLNKLHYQAFSLAGGMNSWV